MTNFEHILVPTDFEAAADAALDTALSLATRLGARLTIMHSAWLSCLAYASYGDGLTFPTDEMDRMERAQLAATVERARTRCPRVESVFVTGEPWLLIIEVAKAQRADVIVMGTHGRRSLSHLFLGSVAERVVRLSPIPVLTVSTPEASAIKQSSLVWSAKSHP